jgi:GH25 family lysozyme M1 (1,4-beta-N-acetylmuramidase)
LDICRQQLAIAQEAGMRIAVYDYLYFEDPTFDLRRQRAITIAKEFGGLEVWLDVEDEEHHIGPPAIVTLTKRAAGFCEVEGLPWGIYSSRSKWLKLTNDSQEFLGAPLWDANYRPEREIDDYYVPYGGWIRPLIHQYQGTTDLCGVTVDLNWADLPV